MKKIANDHDAILNILMKNGHEEAEAEELITEMIFEQCFLMQWEK